MPLFLFTCDRYIPLSSNAKLLYSIILNRMKLSEKNKEKFHDENGTFIYFSNNSIRKQLHCCKDTATKSLIELEQVGLIRKEYQKTGQPLKIYINDILHLLDNTHRVEKERVYKPNSNPRPSFAEKEVSFDIKRAEEMAKRNRRTFGDKPKRRIF